MRVMGIDPGLTRCGIGVVEVTSHREARLVHVEVARSPANMADHFRLQRVGNAIAAAIAKWQPEVVAIERVFAKENRQSVTTTMQAMGVAMYCVAEAGLPLAIQTPSEVKAAITGSGTAGKAQVQHMVARILRLDAPPSPPDAADALAIAICHAWKGSGLVGTGPDGSVDVSVAGAVRARGELTPAQEKWAQALAGSRRRGVTDPNRKRRRG